MAIPRQALELIEHFEGYHKRLADGRAAPYLCPARVPTIGIGSTFYEDRRPVTLADPPIDRERAYELLGFELRECEAAVDRLTLVKLPALSRGALVSFVYNAGAGAYRASGLRRRVNARDWAAVPAELLKWRMGGGVVLPGLERRRRAEAALFMAGIKGEAYDVETGDGARRAGVGAARRVDPRPPQWAGVVVPARAGP